MAIYRFKVAFEDNEDVYREIEIKSTQTFEELHNTIVQSISFDNQHNASFYISDDYWRKGDEIILRSTESSENGSRKKQEIDTSKKQMSKCKMASLIDDPHQKFVYVYDPKTAWTFLVELLKIVPDDAKASYPRVAKSAGEPPKQYKPTTVVAAAEEEEFEEEPHTDEVAYENAHSEDETALLGSEEGEEVTAEEELVESEEDEGDASEFDDHAGENFEED